MKVILNYSTIKIIIRNIFVKKEKKQLFKFMLQEIVFLKTFQKIKYFKL